jgi:2-dehydro-3-deoxyphosphooctonate aldolase (KDO 8-P synthase)
LSSKFSWLENISGNDNPLFFIIGPCVIESESHSLYVAEFLKTLSLKLKFNFIFKSSFDKANRTSVKKFRGIGFDDGLKILEKVRLTFDIPVITDVHESFQVDPVAQVVDVIQIPAFLCRQTDLLVAAGNSQKTINIKKGPFLAPESMEHVIGKVESVGNKKIWICERGYSFGYNNLIVDYRNFPIMKPFGKPIVFDATHSVQRPGGQGCSSGGDRRFLSALTPAAVVQGIASVFMEVHEEPERAPCDGPNSIRLSGLEDFLRWIMDLDFWTKSNPTSKLI